jgi:hypothetical protein
MRQATTMRDGNDYKKLEQNCILKGEIGFGSLLHFVIFVAV